MTASRINLRKMILIAMFTALAVLLVWVINIPIVPGVEFLKYEPKDVIIAISAFLLGPIEGIVVSVLSSVIEMFTISTTGPIGMIMNILSTVFYILPASMIYRKKKTFAPAVIGLASGVVIMTAGMLLWNYIITPFYQGVPRAVIASMLLPVFAPYNLLKGALNSAVVIMIYKPIATALRKTGFVASAKAASQEKAKTPWIILGGAVFLAAIILIILKMNHVL